MKVEFGESNVRITLETERELRDYESWVSQARNGLPKLIKLCNLEPQVLQFGELFKWMEEEKAILRTFRSHWETEEGSLVFIRGDRTGGNPGRPLGDRAIIAAFRLLSGAPYDWVLKQEKEWRIREYLSRVRDKNVGWEMRDATHKAQRGNQASLSKKS